MASGHNASPASGYRQERLLAGMIALILVVIALWPPAGGALLTWGLLTGCAALLLVAWRRPGWLSPVTRLWLRLGHLLGVLNTWLLLVLAYYLVITPLALLFRVLRRDALALRLRRRSSYWIRRDRGWSRDSFRNQF